MTHTPENLTTFLDEQQAIADAATPGEWDNDHNGEVWLHLIEREEDGYLHVQIESDRFQADAAFIAASRQTVPRLIEIARSLLAECEQLRGQVERALYLMEEMDKFITAYRGAWIAAKKYAGREGDIAHWQMMELADEHGLPEAGE